MVHRALGPNNVYLGFYSRDFYIPLLVGAAIALDALNREKPLVVGFQKITGALNLALLWTLALALSYWDWVALRLGAPHATGALMVSAAGLAWTAFTAWIPFAALLQRLRPLGLRWLLLVGSVGLLAVYPTLLWKAWLWVGPWTGKAVYAVLKLAGAGVTSIDTTHHMRIHHPKLTALIGPGCSGYEGVFFFLFAFSLFLVLEKSKISSIKCAVTLCLGVAFLFALNVLRIAGFFWMAVRGGAEGAGFLAWAFHENLGWFLYFFGIYLFFTVLLRHRSRLLVASPK